MITTVLFDLDGTLLPIDTDKFVQSYLKLLAGKFAGIVSPDKLLKDLINSTDLMIKNQDPNLTNQEVFTEDFAARIGHDWREVEPIFDNFYLNAFPGLVSCVEGEAAPNTAVAEAIQAGFDVVIATKPVFPRQAIMERLKWIGADQFPYRLVTSYENMHFCKPSLEYYREVLSLIGREPAECVMVGNDVDEDLCAAQLGMKTVLVKDYIINRSGREFRADLCVTSAELPEVIRNRFYNFEAQK